LEFSESLRVLNERLLIAPEASVASVDARISGGFGGPENSWKETGGRQARAVEPDRLECGADQDSSRWSPKLPVFISKYRERGQSVTIRIKNNIPY